MLYDSVLNFLMFMAIVGEGVMVGRSFFDVFMSMLYFWRILW